MDILSFLREFGPETTLLLMFALFILEQNKRLNNHMIAQNKIFTDKIGEIVKSISRIPEMMGKTHYEKQEAIDYFRLILERHITHKLAVVGSILEKNDIYKRRSEIEKRIRTEFGSITKCGAEKLSKINSSVGDMGELLLSVNFDKLFMELFEVLFRKDEVTDKQIYIRTKINDMRTIMESYVNTLVDELSNR